MPDDTKSRGAPAKPAPTADKDTKSGESTSGSSSSKRSPKSPKPASQVKVELPKDARDRQYALTTPTIHGPTLGHFARVTSGDLEGRYVIPMELVDEGEKLACRIHPDATNWATLEYSDLVTESPYDILAGGQRVEEQIEDQIEHEEEQRKEQEKAEKDAKKANA